MKMSLAVPLSCDPCHLFPVTQVTAVRMLSQDQLYAVGGLTRGEDTQLDVSADVLCYNRKRNTWEAVSPMPEPRHAAGVVNADESLFVFGGLKTVSQTEASPDVLRYNHRQDLWETVATLPSALAGFAVVVLPPSSTGGDTAAAPAWGAAMSPA